MQSYNPFRGLHKKSTFFHLIFARSQTSGKQPPNKTANMDDNGNQRKLDDFRRYKETGWGEEMIIFFFVFRDRNNGERERENRVVVPALLMFFFLESLWGEKKQNLLLRNILVVSDPLLMKISLFPTGTHSKKRRINKNEKLGKCKNPIAMALETPVYSCSNG